MPTASIGVPLRKAVADGLAEHFAALSDFNGVGTPEQKTVVGFGYDFAGGHREQVFTGRSRATTPPAAMRSGRNTRNESGQFDLNIEARVVAGDVYDAELRAEQIGCQVEDWFADRKSGEGLDVDGLLTLVCGEWEADYRGIDNGTAAYRTYVIRWTARLE